MHKPKQRRLKIGLTGGIGSGKSQVSDWLAQYGASIIDTDVIAHDLTSPQGAAIEPLRQAFGSEVVSENGALNRQAMREHVFADATARKRLESILHPMIADEALRQADQAAGCYLVFVVPLLVEAGNWRERVDRVCVVDCDEASQIARVKARSGLTTEAIERIMSVQATRQDRLAVADDIIVNDGNTTLAMLQQRTQEQHEVWCNMAKSGRYGKQANNH